MKAGIVAVVLAVTGTMFAGIQSTREVAPEYRPDLVLQLGVTSLDRSVEFYTSTLGFTLTERRDDLKFAHVQSNVPGVEFGLGEVASPRGTGSAVVNIGVVHVGKARAMLEARGVVFKGETEVIPGKVALAAFADPDGNVLRLAGPPDTAATR
jgi:catechol 2,3-dioxygenase-like lactoylglutathione lyase family enzyme